MRSIGQHREFGLAIALTASLVLCPICPTCAQEAPAEADGIEFPVKAEILVEGKFQRSEGIAFNGEGDLYVSANRSLWRVSEKGDVTKIADLYSNLGLARIGERDILMADFGPTNAFNHGKNDDGIVWRITPEGKKSVVARGIGDPNFILVLGDGSFLVSDDATNEIFKVGPDGDTSLFSTAVNHPNGLALSLDGTILYVAQIFNGIHPIVVDNRLWAMDFDNGRITSEPRVVARTGERGANDGLAVDFRGRVYIAANGEGKIWRFDPKTEELLMIAKKMPGVASLAFGEGKFDHETIFATSTQTGRVWKVKVGVSGAPLHH